jgi:hypothetical protein
MPFITRALACLSILSHLDKGITTDSLKKCPRARYAVEHGFEHARFEGVSQNAAEKMKQVFHRRKPHLAVRLWILDLTMLSFFKVRQTTRSPHRQTELIATVIYYAAFCGLREFVNVLTLEHSEHASVDSPSFTGDSTLLRLVSGEGYLKNPRRSRHDGANVTARDKDCMTPLHHASLRGHLHGFSFSTVRTQQPGMKTPGQHHSIARPSTVTSILHTLAKHQENYI